MPKGVSGIGGMNFPTAMPLFSDYKENPKKGKVDSEISDRSSKTKHDREVL